MSSEDEEMDFSFLPDTPDGMSKVAANSAATQIPAASKDKYNKVYEDFHKWNKSNGAPPVSQNVLMTYFSELAAKHKPSTLWVMFSMLKATLRTNDDLDISLWTNLTDYLKRNNVGYKPAKAKMFTEEDVERFIREAPDEQWLDVKVVCIFGVSGAYSASKFVNVLVHHVKEYEDLFLVTVPKTESRPKRTFSITGTFFYVVKKYVDLRPKNTKDNRFFIHYRDGQYRAQPIGRNKIFSMPRRMANFLALPEPERYTVYSFRQTTTSSVSNTSTWVNSVAEEEEDDEYALDYETGLLKTPTISYTKPTIPAASEKNHDTTTGTTGTSGTSGHVCTLRCGIVKCAREENEDSVSHAFSIMKPPDYVITEVSPAMFGSDPFCRWIVAYSHSTEPISSYNALEKFADITRSTPSNVRVIQKYIRWNSSQLFPAYIVVYGVNCRCHKLPTDVSSLSMNTHKHEI